MAIKVKAEAHLEPKQGDIAMTQACKLKEELPAITEVRSVCSRNNDITQLPEFGALTSDQLAELQRISNHFSSRVDNAERICFDQIRFRTCVVLWVRHFRHTIGFAESKTRLQVELSRHYPNYIPLKEQREKV